MRYTTQHIDVIKEGAVSRVADLFYAFRFLRLLTMPWKKTAAFKTGVIDDKGARIRDEKGKRIKPKTFNPKQKAAYTVFHRLVFNLKRMLQKISFGRGTIASYAAALFLIKEHTGMSEKQIVKIMDQVDMNDWDKIPLQESKWFVNIIGELNPGNYTLVNDIASIETGEYIAMTNTKVKITEAVHPYSTFLGESIFKVDHPKTGQQIFITTGDITR
jgi:hypothetical protein